jgi:hypothetical protein
MTALLTVFFRVGVEEPGNHAGFQATFDQINPCIEYPRLVILSRESPAIICSLNNLAFS